jgi:hypothetical protein
MNPQEGGKDDEKVFHCQIDFIRSVFEYQRSASGRIL